MSTSDSVIAALEGPRHPDAARPDRLYRVEAVAQQWDISRAAVYELIRTGQLRSLKIGGSRRIPDSSMREFIERGCGPDEQMTS